MGHSTTVNTMEKLFGRYYFEQGEIEESLDNHNIDSIVEWYIALHENVARIILDIENEKFEIIDYIISRLTCGITYPGVYDNMHNAFLSHDIAHILLHSISKKLDLPLEDNLKYVKLINEVSKRIIRICYAYSYNMSIVSDIGDDILSKDKHVIRVSRFTRIRNLVRTNLGKSTCYIRDLKKTYIIPIVYDTFSNNK